MPPKSAMRPPPEDDADMERSVNQMIARLTRNSATRSKPPEVGSAIF